MTFGEELQAQAPDIKALVDTAMQTRRTPPHTQEFDEQTVPDEHARLLAYYLRDLAIDRRHTHLGTRQRAIAAGIAVDHATGTNQDPGYPTSLGDTVALMPVAQARTYAMTMLCKILTYDQLIEKTEAQLARAAQQKKAQDADAGTGAGAGAGAEEDGGGKGGGQA